MADTVEEVPMALVRCTCIREELAVLVADPLCPASDVHARTGFEAGSTR